jgi:predicted  nucleic acid-binding Zn-ribbon protein
MQLQLDAAQAKVTQQAAALTAAQGAHSTLQVRYRQGGEAWAPTLSKTCAATDFTIFGVKAPRMVCSWCGAYSSPLSSIACGTLHVNAAENGHIQAEVGKGACCALQAQMAEVSRTCSSKEAECRQLQDQTQEQQQKLREAATTAERHAMEQAAAQVGVWTRPFYCVLLTCADGKSKVWVQSVGRALPCTGLTAWQGHTYLLWLCIATVHTQHVGCGCASRLQADLSSAQQQLADLQTQCEALKAERSALQAQQSDTTASLATLREQLQHAQSEASHTQKESDSIAREASSLRMQLSQQVAAMQEWQQAASGSGKELQVRGVAASCSIYSIHRFAAIARRLLTRNQGHCWQLSPWAARERCSPCCLHCAFWRYAHAQGSRRQAVHALLLVLPTSAGAA